MGLFDSASPYIMRLWPEFTNSIRSGIDTGVLSSLADGAISIMLLKKYSSKYFIYGAGETMSKVKV
jgi:hypothetical protein